MDRDSYQNTEFSRQELQQYMYDETPYFQPSQHELERQKLRVPSAYTSKEGKVEITDALRRSAVIAAFVALGIFGFLMANLAGAQNVQGFPGHPYFPMHHSGYFQDHKDFFQRHKHHW